MYATYEVKKQTSICSASVEDWTLLANISMSTAAPRYSLPNFRSSSTKYSPKSGHTWHFCRSTSSPPHPPTPWVYHTNGEYCIVEFPYNCISVRKEIFVGLRETNWKPRFWYGYFVVPYSLSDWLFLGVKFLFFN